jgi:hypothetical protein
LKVKHPTNIGVADLSGDFDLVPEALDRFLFARNLRPDELEGYFFPDLFIIDIDSRPPKSSSPD